MLDSTIFVAALLDSAVISRQVMGTILPSEAVATSVTVGADGFYYVGELRGFPATPGQSQVWRIAPNSVGALCDPEARATVERLGIRLCHFGALSAG